MNHARNVPHAEEGRAISREKCATYRGCGENTSCLRICWHHSIGRLGPWSLAIISLTVAI